ncbi:hypothetical protein, partial [Streptococcus pneumoniae]|uniref:hypothetical protein n=1 Tax=Streptococcus pneumoniae TaxID=1313 RepID=UPI001CB77D53
VIGLIFFVVRYPKLKNMNNDELSRLILNQSERASLSMPSYIALGSWLVIGLIFFVVRYPKLKNMNNDELSRLILNQSER